MSVGSRIKQVRIANGLTQEEFGAKIGVQKSAVAKYENGRVDNLKRTTIETICNTFNVSPQWLLELEDQETSEYYLDEDIRNLAEELSSRPGLKLLFDAAKDIDDKSLKAVAKMIEQLKKTNPDG